MRHTRRFYGSDSSLVCRDRAWDQKPLATQSERLRSTRKSKQSFYTSILVVALTWQAMVCCMFLPVLTGMLISFVGSYLQICAASKGCWQESVRSDGWCCRYTMFGTFRVLVPTNNSSSFRRLLCVGWSWQNYCTSNLSYWQYWCCVWEIPPAVRFLICFQFGSSFVLTNCIVWREVVC